MRKISKIEPYICGATTPLVDVLRRINSVDGLFQCVVDKDSRLIGTVTDGDIRRAILKGAGLEDSVEACVFRNATVGQATDTDQEILRLLAAIDHARPFVPLLGHDRRIVALALQDREDQAPPIGLVMAGGRGSRLGSRTAETPKPLLEVGGRPMLDRVLSMLEDADLSKIFVSVHYLGEQIVRFVDERDSTSEREILYEDVPLGTAGAIALLPERIPTPLLVINADVLTELDIRGMLTFHRKHGHDATIAVATHEVVIPYGVIEQTEDGLFEGIKEKPRVSHFVSSGIYLLEPTFRALLPDKRAIDMPELLELGKQAGLRIGLYPVHEYWTDIGRPEELDAVNERIVE